jgi:hypothetical protein
LYIVYNNRYNRGNNNKNGEKMKAVDWFNVLKEVGLNLKGKQKETAIKNINKIENLREKLKRFDD